MLSIEQRMLSQRQSRNTTTPLSGTPGITSGPTLLVTSTYSPFLARIARTQGLVTMRMWLNETWTWLESLWRAHTTTIYLPQNTRKRLPQEMHLPVSQGALPPLRLWVKPCSTGISHLARCEVHPTP